MQTRQAIESLVKVLRLPTKTNQRVVWKDIFTAVQDVVRDGIYPIHNYSIRPAPFSASLFYGLIECFCWSNGLLCLSRVGFFLWGVTFLLLHGHGCIFKVALLIMRIKISSMLVNRSKREVNASIEAAVSILRISLYAVYRVGFTIS
jgi:hypothetical protein